MSATKNPRFTKRHYDEIHAFTKKLLVLENMPKVGWPLHLLSFVEGVRWYHAMLGKLFYEDNPNFKPEMWRLEKGKIK